MSAIVVGGHTRGVGKTAVVCAILRAFPEWRWTAVKITPHGHRDEAVFEETDALGDADTARYLSAGAARALLVRSGSDGADDGMTMVLRLAAAGELLVIESNSVLRTLAPDLFLFVVRPEFAEWKESGRALCASADAVIVTGPGEAAFGSIPVFRMPDAERLPGALVRLIAERGLPPTGEP